MSEKFEKLLESHIDFIRRQKMFFVGTAASTGLVNVSPKGMDSFRVLSPERVSWLNLTGSGNETAAHVLENNRMTLMFCSFDKQPLILRLYGKAKMVHSYDESWHEMLHYFPEYTGARQIFDVSIDLVQTSCGYAVPMYELLSERPTLTKWADKRGREGIREYWSEKNRKSLDGKDTRIYLE